MKNKYLNRPKTLNCSATHLRKENCFTRRKYARIRPIFMSATTSVLGMLPLVVSTGSGSELYRGLGSILLGGFAVSTIFTLFVIPSLLVFFIGFEKSHNDEVL